MGATRQIDYDKLLIATGAESVKPPIEGLEDPGVFFLHWMDDSFAVKRFMDQRSPKRADIVATALYHGMAAKKLCNLDFSHTPPLSSPWDPVQMAAMEWGSKRQEKIWILMRSQSI
jgi:hypothetical protein